ncbi:MAG TPA: cytochrome c biogenesis protein ResB [Anaeromyxobacteraceae bacterium]|nr:cytochrome c biogenesis protein ResB [Anaeromyxobacteraceae bacterium]
MRRLREAAVSLRTTAVLLSALALLLLLSVALPQAAGDPERFARAVASGPAARFLLVTLGLGNAATSPPFLAVLGLFFLNLAAVLADRMGTTLRRVRFAPPTAAQRDALLGPGALEGALPEGDAGARARQILDGLGYRTAPAGERALWGVKHRLALLGFPVFHLSFFVLCAGGLLLYLTRDVVTVLAAEGQAVDSGSGGVVRRAPLGPPPPVRIAVDRVDVRLEEGRPVHLSAALRLDAPGAPPQTARVNHPAAWGHLSVLVERAGIAPVLWLVDGQGYTLDRVAVLVAAPGGLPTRVKLGPAADLEAVVEPAAMGSGFPERAGLPTAGVRLRLVSRDRDVFEGTLRPGQAAEADGRRLVLQEVRYWAGLRLVSERGGGVLVAGFLLAVVGIAWRMVWARREVVVAWDGGRLRLGGRGEFTPARFREELEAIRDLVSGPRSGAGSGGAS